MEIKDCVYEGLFNGLSKNDTQNVFTPPRLIRRMLSRVNFNNNDKVLVWYNIEFLVYLVKEIGLSPKNIYIYTNTQDKLILEKQGYHVVYQCWQSCGILLRSGQRKAQKYCSGISAHS